jgi:hypothetical protein
MQAAFITDDKALCIMWFIHFLVAQLATVDPSTVAATWKPHW